MISGFAINNSTFIDSVDEPDIKDFGLQKGLCITLDLETSDIGVSWRWLANKSTRTGAEIILYDFTPGGSGFVKEGFGNWEQVVRKAQMVCDD